MSKTAKFGCALLMFLGGVVGGALSPVLAARAAPAARTGKDWFDPNESPEAYLRKHSALFHGLLPADPRDIPLWAHIHTDVQALQSLCAPTR